MLVYLRPRATGVDDARRGYVQEERMQRVAGARILVTGATDGLGREVAGALARAGALVLVHGRHPDRVARTAAAMADDTAHEPTGYVADFAELAQVRRLAEAVRADHDRLDVLVNNAGIGGGAPGAERQTSADGYELRFQVNYLAAFLLTRLLLPLLRASAPARVVNVASGAQQPIDFDDMMLEGDYDGWRAYSQSKLAMVADTFALAEELDPRQVTVNSLHPASFMDTKMVREAFGRASTSVQEGVDPVLRLVADPELEGVTGRYYNRRSEARAASQAYDAAAREELVRRSRDLTGL
jgi:NAD(P)-dependent dehydrogenase (short-subunit alcohol dehydrogenase family)